MSVTIAPKAPAIPARRYLTSREASARAAALGLPVSKATLDSLRTRGGGPAYVKLGTSRNARVRYPAAAFDSWLSARLEERTSTAEG